MEHSVTEMPRGVRRRLRRVVHKSRDKDYARRALAILQLWETGEEVSEVAHRLCAARSSVYRWRGEFAEFGEAGIAPQPRGRADWKASEELLEHLEELVGTEPQELGYLRSRWSSELLALELEKRTGTEVHATTVRRWLKRLGFGYRRARPTLCKRDPRKSRRLRAIGAALADVDPQTEVFYADEADVDFNPRIGPAWMPRGAQTAIPTPGKNQKRYFAAALHARTGRLVWVEHERKDSCLFIHLLYTLKRTYRRARRIVLIVDNYSIHMSYITRRWLANNPKFELLFQPAYHPWVNEIERLWKALHDTVTRNHRHGTMRELLTAVRRFLQACQPFPGNGHALAAA
jgi:transposase